MVTFCASPLVRKQLLGSPLHISTLLQVFTIKKNGFYSLKPKIEIKDAPDLFLVGPRLKDHASQFFISSESENDWLQKKPPERCKLPFQRNCAVFAMDKFKETARIILICGVSFLPLIWSLKKKSIPLPFFILAPITIQTPPTNENSPKTEHLLTTDNRLLPLKQ